MMGDKQKKREKKRKRQQEIGVASRVRVVDVAEWITVKVEVTNIDRLEKAIQKSLDSQRALTLQTQSLLAEMQRRGVLKRLGGYIWQLCQQFRDSLLRDDNGDVVCDDAGDALEG